MERDSFTDAEILQAFRIALGDNEARQLLQSIRGDERTIPGLSDTDAVWSDDTLIILSLLSDDLERRVEAYVQAGLHGSSAEAQAWVVKEWSERREAMRSWVEQRKKELPPLSESDGR